MLIICLLILVLIVYYYYKSMYSWRSRNVKQARLPVPFLGDTTKFTFRKEANIDMIKRLYKRFPNVRYSGVYQLGMRTLILHDPELIKQITVKDFDHFVDHLNFSGEMEPLWSKNLFALKGDAWKQMRSTLSPSFTSSKMRLMFELMEKSAQQYVDYYLQKEENTIELELKDSLTRFANDVIANCAFGITVDSLKNPTNEFYMHGKAVTNFGGVLFVVKFIIGLFMPGIAKFLGLRLFPAKTMNFFQKLVSDTVRLREEQNIVRPDMIHLLIEARRGQLKHDDCVEKNESAFATIEESSIGRSAIANTVMTDVDMAAQALLFFFGGFDSTSTFMAFAVYELAVNPDVQDRLRKEIDETTAANNGKLTYDLLNKMKYLDMVITETLRKDPAFSVVDRVCTKPYIIQPTNPDEKPVQLSPGDVLWIPIAGLHADERYYPNPEKFDPERFSVENKDRINPYSFVAFGAGPRSCIATRFALLEAKVLLFHLLRHFELIVIKKTQIPIKYSKDVPVPTIDGGFWVGFKRRVFL